MNVEELSVSDSRWVPRGGGPVVLLPDWSIGVASAVVAYSEELLYM